MNTSKEWSCYHSLDVHDDDCCRGNVPANRPPTCDGLSPDTAQSPPMETAYANWRPPNPEAARRGAADDKSRMWQHFQGMLTLGKNAQGLATRSGPLSLDDSSPLPRNTGPHSRRNLAGCDDAIQCPAHASKIASLASSTTGSVFANQRSVTYSPASSQANNKPSQRTVANQKQDSLPEQLRASNQRMGSPTSKEPPPYIYNTATGAAAVERLACSPLTKENRVQSPAGSLPHFRKWESRRTMPLVSEFSFRRCSILTSITLIGSQDLAYNAGAPGMATGAASIRALRHISSTAFAWNVNRKRRRKNHHPFPGNWYGTHGRRDGSQACLGARRPSHSLAELLKRAGRAECASYLCATRAPRREERGDASRPHGHGELLAEVIADHEYRAPLLKSPLVTLALRPPAVTPRRTETATGRRGKRHHIGLMPDRVFRPGRLGNKATYGSCVPGDSDSAHDPAPAHPGLSCAFQARERGRDEGDAGACIKRPIASKRNVLNRLGASVVQWLDYSPPTTTNRVRFPAGSPSDFHMWESCRTITLVGGFSRRAPISPTLSFRRCSILTSLHPRRLSRPRFAPQFSPGPTSPECSRVLRAPSRTVAFTLRVSRPFFHSHHEHLVRRRLVISRRVAQLPHSAKRLLARLPIAQLWLVIIGRAATRQRARLPVGGEGRGSHPLHRAGPRMTGARGRCQLQRVRTLGVTRTFHEHRVGTRRNHDFQLPSAFSGVTARPYTTGAPSNEQPMRFTYAIYYGVLGYGLQNLGIFPFPGGEQSISQNCTVITIKLRHTSKPIEIRLLLMLLPASVYQTAEYSLKHELCFFVGLYFLLCTVVKAVHDKRDVDNGYLNFPLPSAIATAAIRQQEQACDHDRERNPQALVLELYTAPLATINMRRLPQIGGHGRDHTTAEFKLYAVTFTMRNIRSEVVPIDSHRRICAPPTPIYFRRISRINCTRPGAQVLHALTSHWRGSLPETCEPIVRANLESAMHSYPLQGTVTPDSSKTTSNQRWSEIHHTARSAEYEPCRGSVRAMIWLHAIACTGRELPLRTRGPGSAEEGGTHLDPPLPSADQLAAPSFAWLGEGMIYSGPSAQRANQRNFWAMAYDPINIVEVQGSIVLCGGHLAECTAKSSAARDGLRREIARRRRVKVTVREGARRTLEHCRQMGSGLN
ncbi:hypothetical protein PR048_000853 [Dryococelus australis]|uniref:Uncharacterized protein n=1 Tax=Dryococelus australis TaxID=614101 RepID=A0ABQ9IFS0_9NEOP|nr:hypothetical protein PR048_000853 [Dryococelus australis]